MDIVVTIPKSEYKNDDLETEQMNNNGWIQFWRFKHLPTKLCMGDRIYFVRDNIVESSMKVIDFSLDTVEKCNTTNRQWSGNIVYISDLRYENLPFKIKGFQGFRYRWW